MNVSIVRIGGSLLTNYFHRTIARRCLSYYPIDDTLFNLDDEQIQVKYIDK